MGAIVAHVQGRRYRIIFDIFTVSQSADARADSGPYFVAKRECFIESNITNWFSCAGSERGTYARRERENPQGRGPMHQRQRISFQRGRRAMALTDWVGMNRVGWFDSRADRRAD